MALRASYFKRTFNFSFPAVTSRGSMENKDSWFLKIWDQQNPEVFGIGEAGLLIGLSLETSNMVEQELSILVSDILPKLSLSELKSIDEILDRINISALSSSVIFALEIALLDLQNGGRRLIFENNFYFGQQIPINGLVWMGDFDYIFHQVENKIKQGYDCIKLKVGALSAEKELEILRIIRTKYIEKNITIRLDANGYFNEDNVLIKLKKYAEFIIHSIEQPLKAKSEFLGNLCKCSPIPIAIDEELIGINSIREKEKLISQIKPAYIVLKPSLHGGINGCLKWIEIAKKYNVGWWITSALESNIGLNAISQFAASFPIKIPQGLGTGSIYKNNIISPLEAKGGWLKYNFKNKWELPH